MDEFEKNVREQLLASITGKGHVTNEDRSLLALPPRMGGLDSLVTRTFSEIMTGREAFMIR